MESVPLTSFSPAAGHCLCSAFIASSSYSGGRRSARLRLPTLTLTLTVRTIDTGAQVPWGAPAARRRAYRQPPPNGAKEVGESRRVLKDRSTLLHDEDVGWPTHPTKVKVPLYPPPLASRVTSILVVGVNEHLTDDARARSLSLFFQTAQGFLFSLFSP